MWDIEFIICVCHIMQLLMDNALFILIRGGDMSSAVVIGGGIAGIYSAILLKKRYESVFLIEKEQELGGLLRSFHNEGNDWFDYGTHFIAETNIKDIDEVIVDKSWTKGWRKFDSEKVGNFFNGVLNEGEAFVDAKEIGANYYRGLNEFLEKTYINDTYTDSEDQLENTFGQTFTQEIFKPSLCKIFCVDSLAELVAGANLLFGMKRIKVLNSKASKLIKTLPTYDAKMSYHADYSPSKGYRTHFYPKVGGVGVWVDQMRIKLDALGVTVLCGRSVKKIGHKGRVINRIVMDNDEVIDCDNLVWTIPLVFLFRAAGIECSTVGPRLLNTTLLHFTFDSKPLSDDHYFYCYDPSFLPFRVTLYSNLQPEVSQSSGRHRVTVEVLSSGVLDAEKTCAVVIMDLIKMKVIPSNSKVLYQKIMSIPNGFPVMDHSYAKSFEFQSHLAINSFKNLSLQGKNNTRDWFMADVLKSIYHEFGR